MTLLATDIDPLVPLQEAMYATLKGDAVLPTLSDTGEFEIYDRVSDASYPYATIGDDRLVPDDIDCGTMSEVFSTVRVYSRGRGRTEAKRLAGRIRWLLDKDRGFSVEGFKLNTGVCESSDPRTHQDGVTVHYEINFRYLLTALDPRQFAAGGSVLAGLVSAAVAELDIAATASSSFAALQSSSIAEMEGAVDAVGASVLAGLISQSAATLKIEAIAISSFAPMSNDATAGLAISGQAIGSFAGLQTSGSAALDIDAVGVRTFAPLTTDAVAELTLAAIGASAFAGVTSAAGAQIGSEVTASGSSSFAGLDSSAQASLSLDAAGSSAFASIESVASAELAISGQASGSFAGVESAGSAALDIDAVGVRTFAPLTTDAVAELAIAATGGSQFAGLTTSASAAIAGDVEAVGSSAFASIESAASAELTISAQASGSFAGLQSAAVGSAAIDAVGSGSFAALESASLGETTISGQASGSFAGLQSTAVGSVAITATATSTFAPAISSSVSELSIAATASGSFAPITSSGTGSVVAGATNEPETDAYIARLSAAPSAARETNYNDLIKGLKDDGLWSKIDVLHWYENDVLADAILNFKSASFPAVKNAALVHTPGGGIAGNTNYDQTLQSNFTPSTDGVAWTTELAHVGIWRDKGANGNLEQLLYTFNDAIEIYEISNGSTYWAFGPNGNTTAASAIPDNDAHIVMTGDSAGDAKLVVNGVDTQTVGAPSGAFDNDEEIFVIFGENDSTAKFFHAGGYLTPTEVANLYSRLSAFRTAVAAE